MRELNLKEIKQKELGIMRYIDSFCRKNDIKYTLAGGTMLGAVRHKGFIPWDDDIDIFMVRDQYNRFLDLFSKEEGQYCVVNYKNNNDYGYLFSKVVDKNTTLIEKHNKKVSGLGVFVDVFPIDSMANTIEESEKKLKSVNLKRYLCVAANWKHFYINHNHGILRQIPRFIFFIASRHVNVRKVYESIETKFLFDSNIKYYGLMCGAYGGREIMPKDVYLDVVDFEFEGLKLYGMKQYDYYLSRVFGDYMKLPPEDKRITHHTFDAYEL